MPDQLRWSYQKASTTPVPLTDTHGMTWSLPGRSSLTRTGPDQVEPRSVERETKTSRTGTDGASRSTQTTYRLPRFAPLEVSAATVPSSMVSSRLKPTLAGKNEGVMERTTTLGSNVVAKLNERRSSSWVTGAVISSMPRSHRT